MPFVGLTRRLEALATDLESKGSPRLASLLDAVSNTMEKTAANRRMREFLFKKLEEWFPGKIDKMPKEVALEIVDGLAYSLLELTSPGKNRVTDKSQMYEYIDKETGKPEQDLLAKVRALFEGEAPQIPTLSGGGAKFYRDFSRALADGLVSPGHPSAKDPSQLVDGRGKIKQAPLAYLLAKVVPDALAKFPEMKDVPAQDVVAELASAVSALEASRHNYAGSLVKVLTGGIETRESAQYRRDQRGGQKLDTSGMTPDQAQEALLARLGSSSILYNKLRNLIDTSWAGPVNVTVDPNHLERTFVPKHAEEIKVRLNTISHSEFHKDEERLQGAKSRMLKSFGGKMPAPGVPWNKGGEVLLEKVEGGYLIREGWHRVLAMLDIAQGSTNPSFTLSAYVHTKVPKGVIKTLVDEVAKHWKLRA